MSEREKVRENYLREFCGGRVKKKRTLWRMFRLPGFGCED